MGLYERVTRPMRPSTRGQAGGVSSPAPYAWQGNLPSVEAELTQSEPFWTSCDVWLSPLGALVTAGAMFNLYALTGPVRVLLSSFVVAVTGVPAQQRILSARGLGCDRFIVGGAGVASGPVEVTLRAFGKEPRA